jgi:undecaprenyl phosphate-alpha-L-ara4N flippase subunit ArnF
MTGAGIAITGFAVATAIIADFFIKTASQKEPSLLTSSFAIGAGLYVLSAVGWLFAMKTMTLAQVGVLYSVVTILALTAMGVLWFEETLGWQEVLGIVFALVSVLLMGRFL